MNRLPKRLALAALTTALAGCAVGPDFKSPDAPATDHYTPAPQAADTVAAPGLAGGAQHFEKGADIPLEWWALFHSNSLDQMVKSAIAHSPTLGAAQASLRQARETLHGETGSLLFPNVNAQLQGQRARESGITLGDPGISVEGTALIAALNLTYNFDVFGGERRTIEGFAAQVDVANYEVEATYLTLTTGVVTSAIREAMLRAQIKATNEVLAAEQHQLELIRRQYELGAVTKSAVLMQETQVETTRSTLPPLEKSLAQTRHQIAVLMGQPPSDTDIPEITLEELQLPAQIPVMLPSELVRKRPDIAASEAQLHYASAQVGVATAAQYPSFGISAQYGKEALTWSNLFKSQSTIWSLGGSITQPIFYAGQLTSQKRAAVAAYEGAREQYRQTVLLALENVADNLRALDIDARNLESVARVETLAHDTLNLTETQYRLGAVSSLALLDAQRQFAQAHVNLVAAQANRFSDTAALFQSMGGGWWNRTDPLAQAVAPDSSTN